jgi:poly(3-hydroxybutyrate) depolymerase
MGSADADATALGEMVDSVAARCPVDRGRVLLTGMSDGAAYLTLRRSRNPSPTRLTASTVAARKAPGKRMIQKARCT